MKQEQHPRNNGADAEAPKRKRGEHATPRSKWRKHKRPGNGSLLTIDELAAALGETPRTIRSWSHSAAIPVIVLGHRSIRFSLKAVEEALLKKRTVKAVMT